MTLGSVGYARIEVLTNPENDFDESVYSNGGSLSQPFIVRTARQRDDSAKPRKPPGRSLRFRQLRSESQNKAKVAASEGGQTRGQGRGTKRDTDPRENFIAKSDKGGINVAKAAVSVGSEITKLPSQVYDKSNGPLTAGNRSANVCAKPR